MQMLTLTILVGALLASLTVFARGTAAPIARHSESNPSIQAANLLYPHYLAYRGSGRRTVTV